MESSSAASIQPQARRRVLRRGWTFTARMGRVTDRMPPPRSSRRATRDSRATRRRAARALYAEWAAGVAGDPRSAAILAPHPGDAPPAAARLRRHAPARRAGGRVRGVGVVARGARRRGRRRGVAAQPADQRAAAVRGAAARAERHRRADRAARARRERGTVPLPRPLLVPLSAAGPTSTRRTARRRSCSTCDGHRRPAAADAGGRVARRHRPRSARRRGPGGSAVPHDASCGRARTGRAARIEAALDIVAADPPLLIARRRHRSRRAPRRRGARPGRRDARRDDPGRAAAHPARRSRAAASRRSRRWTPSGSRSTRRDCTTRGIRRSIRRRGAASSSAATAFRSPPSTHSARSWSGAPARRRRRR